MILKEIKETASKIMSSIRLSLEEWDAGHKARMKKEEFDAWKQALLEEKMKKAVDDQTEDDFLIGESRQAIRKKISEGYF